VPDVDSAFKTALDAGAKQEQPVQNQFWGDKLGTLTDPFGHKWSLATHVEEVSETELGKRFEEWSAKQKQAEPA
ncbi:MAG: VOC family protein, partial [Sphingomicrobium sp.]